MSAVVRADGGVFVDTNSAEFKKACAGMAYTRGERSLNPAVRREVAVQMVWQDARARRHAAIQQGLALECQVCGKTCAIDPETLTVHGELADGECQR